MKTNNNLLTNLRKRAKRQHLQVLALVVFLFSFGVLFFWSVQMYLDTTSFTAEHIAEEEMEVPEWTLTASSSLPRTLHIPSIDVTASFETPLGLHADGSIEVPESYDTVGWYKYGPTPGELGPTVVLGHVDSYEGPAVFFSLGQVSVGDRIEIGRTDGSTAVFEVSGMERVEQSAFPTERVYGTIPYAGIRLITCTGIYDKETFRYTHNLIVYGKLVAVEGREKTAE